MERTFGRSLLWTSDGTPTNRSDEYQPDVGRPEAPGQAAEVPADAGALELELELVDEDEDEDEAEDSVEPFGQEPESEEQESEEQAGDGEEAPMVEVLAEPEERESVR
ncbi:MAG: hypothetical protein QG608_619 [Actinomycetota bacterium]|nr:hypothetical protein [Actinomycetota bacterium]